MRFLLSYRLDNCIAGSRVEFQSINTKFGVKCGSVLVAGREKELLYTRSFLHIYMNIHIPHSAHSVTNKLTLGKTFE